MRQTPGRTLFAALLAVLAVLAVLALSGCYIYGKPTPANVPSDFPVYPGADPTSQIYGAPPLADGSKNRSERYDITWRSDDSGGKLFAFYKDGLAKGDWVEQSATGQLIIFTRKSNPAWGGTVFLADGKIHVIMGDGCPCGVPT